MKCVGPVTVRYQSGTGNGTSRALGESMRFLRPCILLVSVAACAGRPPPASVDLGALGRAPRAERISLPPDTDVLRTAARFPAGPGTSLVVDDLHAALLDPRVRRPNASALERTTIAAELLHVEPTAEGDAWVFYGIGPRTTLAPYSCHALRIDAYGPTLELDDHRGCGLPYADPTAAKRPPHGPRFTLRRLQDAVSQDHVAWLGAPDRIEGTRSTWFGVGPRADDAPITCHALRRRDGVARIERVPLDACEIVWPAPARGFASPVPQRTYVERELDELCHPCGPRDVCVLVQDAPSLARIHRRGDVVSARYDDGRPAPLVVTASCRALPSTCADPFQCAAAISCPSGSSPRRMERGGTGAATRATCEP